jgi:hypothetical protein
MIFNYLHILSQDSQSAILHEVRQVKKAAFRQSLIMIDSSLRMPYSKSLILIDSSLRMPYSQSLILIDSSF